MSTKKNTESRAPTSVAKRSVIAAGVALVAVALAGAGGVYYGHTLGEPARIEARERVELLERDQELLRAELATARDELATARRREEVLEARRELALAIDQLDSRNFGLAQVHRDASAERLRASEPSPALSALAQQLEQHRFDAGADFEVARRELREMAATLDGHLAPHRGEADPTDLAMVPSVTVD